MKYTYESSEMFLSMARKEYQDEKDRAAALDSKIAFSIPVISAYFFLLAQDTNIKKLWPVTREAAQFVSLFLYLVAICAAFLALVWMIHSTWAHNFKEIEITQSNNAKVMSMPKELFSARTATYYLRRIERNRKENGVRAREYKLGWIFCIISLACFLPYTLIAQGL